MTNKTRRFVIVWLGICCALIFAMVLLGGAVRLTGSGLSMVHWKPISGIFPPVTESAWTEVFDQYKQFPQYHIVNAQITLENFKFIYWMEYSHRILGRLIGLVFFLPFSCLFLSKKLDAALSLKLWILFTMGAVQGGVGWYMVKSGLIDNPRVDPYRLVLHLMIAILIYAYMLRVLAGLCPGLHLRQPVGAKSGGWVLGIVLLMIASGGLVAGTRAGFIYNTFPTMGGEWIPAEMGMLSPWWLNIFANPVTIQFIHRMLAMLVLILVIHYALLLVRDQANGQSKFIGLAMIIAVVLQLSVGITTLLWRVPVVWGVAHQAGALLLLGTIVIAVASGRSGGYLRKGHTATG